jgi:hypothetical protein
MLRHFATMNRDVLSGSLLVTLTYPRSFPTEPSISKRHFHAFSKRLLRAYPTSSATWKLEYQTRGAPHYHLIVSGISFLERTWLSKAWYEVVGSGDPRHLRAGTQVERCDSTRQALAYAAKYCAKVSTGAPVAHVGRFWGVIGRANLDQSVIRWPLDRSGHARLSRFIRNLVGSRPRKTPKRRSNVGWCFANGARGVAAITAAAGLRCSPVTAKESRTPTLAPWRPTGGASATWWMEAHPGLHVAVVVRPLRVRHADAIHGATGSTRSAPLTRRRKRRASRYGT